VGEISPCEAKYAFAGGESFGPRCYCSDTGQGSPTRRRRGADDAGAETDVNLAALLGSGSRVIEVYPHDARLAEDLSRRGHDHYLGLVEPGRLDEVRRSGGEIGSRFQALEDPSVIVRHDADLLVLPADFATHLWLARDLQHLRYLAVEVAGPASLFWTRVAGLAERAAGRVLVKGYYTAVGRRYRVVEFQHRREPRARRYLSPVWGAEGLRRRLDDIGIDYVVLRWFEGLPNIEPGEDLDMLVADEHVDKLHELLAEEPGTIPVDAYSQSGVGRADYKGIAYYPPRLAGRILEGAVVHESGFRVPNGEDHLHSLAYHAVYHNGDRSGLWSTVLERRHEDPEHDYLGTLEQLARRLRVALPVGSLEELDEYLASVGWRPSLDALLRLAPSNPWIEARFFGGRIEASELPETAVFVLRDRALATISLSEVRRTLDHFGFEVLLTRTLDEAAQERCVAEMRGGNWGKGPYGQSGGGPAAVIVAVHYGPKEPLPAVRASYPHLSNNEVLETKRRLRDLVNSPLEPDEHCNPVHSSDSELEAWEYIRMAVPDEVAYLAAAVAQRREEYRPTADVVRTLSLGRRAKVELVRHGDGLAVKKTFGRGHHRFLVREIEALRELGPRVPQVPELLATGPNWMLCPAYQDQLAPLWHTGRLVPLRLVREMVTTLRAIHDLGYAQIDAKPQNFLFDPSEGLKIIDFEFLYRYPGSSPTFAASYSLVGVPDEFDGEVPVGRWTYERRWRRKTGLSLESLISAPAYRQRLHRMGHRLRSVLPGRSAGPRTVGRRVRAELRKIRRRFGARYITWARRWVAYRAPADARRP
jgi:hypothetical protein